MSDLVREVDKSTEEAALTLIAGDPNRAADILATCVSYLCDQVGPRVVAEGLFRTADNLVACE